MNGIAPLRPDDSTLGDAVLMQGYETLPERCPFHLCTTTGGTNPDVWDSRLTFGNNLLDTQVLGHTGPGDGCSGIADSLFVEVGSHGDNGDATLRISRMKSPLTIANHWPVIFFSTMLHSPHSTP